MTPTTLLTVFAFIVVLLIGINAGSGNALLHRFINGGVSVPRRIISQEEITRFTTTGTSGEIVMIGTLGLLLDQGYQSINISTSDIVFYGGSTANTERMRLQSSTGYLGLGTSTPSANLTVAGSGLFTGSVGIGTTVVSGAVTLHTGAAPSNPFGVGAVGYDSSSIVLGNVGFSTATGSGFGALSMSYNSAVQTGYLGMTGGNNTYWKNLAYGAYSHSFYTSNNVGQVGIATSNYFATPTLYLSSTGQVGVGTTSPIDQFHVAGNMVIGATPVLNSSTTSKLYLPSSSYSGSLSAPISGNAMTIYSGDMITSNWGNTVTASQLYLRAGSVVDTTSTSSNKTSTNYQGGSVYIMSGSASLYNTSVSTTTYVAGDIILTTGTGSLGKSSPAPSSGAMALGYDQERFRISGVTGYVGIGTSAAASNLHVYKTNVYTSYLTTPSASQVIIGGGSYGTSYGRLYLGNAADQNGQVSMIQSSVSTLGVDTGSALLLNPLGGNIGVGTSYSQLNKLMLYGGNTICGLSVGDHTTNAMKYIGITSYNNGTSTGAGSGFSGIILGGPNDGGTSGYMSFSTHNYGVSSGERMRITKEGYVGIGTATPSNTFHVYSSVAGEGGMRVQNFNSGSGSYSILRVQNDNPSSTCNLFLNSSTRSADGGANTATLRNDVGALRLQSSSGKGITVDTSGNVTFDNGGYAVSGFDSGGGQYRMIYGSYGAFFRNDGVNTYLLLTNSGDPNGSYNNLRPFYINNASGMVSMYNGLTLYNVPANFTAGATISGACNISNGVTISGAIANLTSGATITNGLGVSGACTMANGLAVTGTATATNVNVTGTLTVNNVDVYAQLASAISQLAVIKAQLALINPSTGVLACSEIQISDRIRLMPNNTGGGAFANLQEKQIGGFSTNILRISNNDLWGSGEFMHIACNTNKQVN